MIVNGDIISQIDLPRKVKSGLIDATELIKFRRLDSAHFSAKDVVHIQLPLRLSPPVRGGQADSRIKFGTIISLV